MAKLSKIFSAVGKIFFILAFIGIGVLCIAMAYIMFAPDDWPKPFTLVYSTAAVQPDDILNSLMDPPTPEPTPLPTIAPTLAISPGEGLMEAMSTKIINLADTPGTRYIRLTVVLEFRPDAPVIAATATTDTADPNATLKAEIDARMPIMDDAVINLVATKTYDDLYTADGKEKLRQEIMDAINKRLPEFHVMSVYFTEFVVQ
jgi:flagellar basal body-associated protein FliL